MGTAHAGRSVHILTLENAEVRSSTVQPKSLEPKETQWIDGRNISHPIFVMKLGEGFFGNGGWVLRGGLLNRITTGPDTIMEFYVKVIVRRFPYFPFPAASRSTAGDWV